MSQRFYSRRELLQKAGGGIGSLALADLLMRDQASAATNGVATTLESRKPHFAAKAKAVISIFCYGGVSQMDTFDPKPDLYKHRGEAITSISVKLRVFST